MLAVEVTGLSKTLGGLGRRQKVLRGVEIQVPRGTVFGLIGPNGAGKTTFLKSLLGILRPSSGTVRVLDHDPEEPRVRARIGYLPERLHFAPGATALAFLGSVARLRRLKSAGDDIHRQLGRVGLTADARRKASAFSKGMKQRLGLAAALLGQPELLILDEPTDGIDPIGRKEMRSLLVEEQGRGATVFISSHLLSETERLCDRVGILVDGRVVREGDLETMCRAERCYRLRFAETAAPEALAKLGFEPLEEAGAYRLEVDDVAALNLAIAGARDTGALLVEMAPEVRGLEEILVDAVGEESP